MGEHGIDSEARHNKEPEDHIGLMLQLAAWIAQNKPELTAEYLELHLLTWSGHFLDVMEEAAKHPAYRALARLTAVTLDAMQSELGLHPVIPRFYR
jgi:TorA maturation chaperone TorD